MDDYSRYKYTATQLSKLLGNVRTARWLRMKAKELRLDAFEVPADNGQGFVWKFSEIAHQQALNLINTRKGKGYHDKSTKDMSA